MTLKKEWDETNRNSNIFKSISDIFWTKNVKPQLQLIVRDI